MNTYRVTFTHTESVDVEAEDEADAYAEGESQLIDRFDLGVSIDSEVDLIAEGSS